MKASHLFAATLLCVAGSASASTLDLTTVHASHWDGGSWVAGMPAGWSYIASADSIALSKDDPASVADSPHLQTPSVFGDFELVVRVAAPADNMLSVGPFADFFGGYAGISIGKDFLNPSFGFGGDVSAWSPIAWSGSWIDVRLSRSGSDFAFDYSFDGTTFFNLYTKSGAIVAGPAVFDFTGYVPPGYPTAAAFQYNLKSFSGAVPEPATWAMLVAGFGLAGAALRSKTERRWRFA